MADAFKTYAIALWRSASSTYASSANIESITTRQAGTCSCTRRATSSPFRSGSWTSRMATSVRNLLISSIAVSPSAANVALRGSSEHACLRQDFLREASHVVVAAGGGEGQVERVRTGGTVFLDGLQDLLG